MKTLVRPTTEIIEVTPRLAEEWLGQNTRNRRVNQRMVRFLAREIEEQRWRLTNDAVAIAPDGTLLNGQHRLRAIIEADRPAVLLVLRDAPPVNQLVMDTGNRRNLADALYIAGFSNLAPMAATIRFIFRMQDSQPFSMTLSKRYPHQAMMDFALTHETELTEAVRMSVHVRQWVRFPGSIIAGLWYLQSDIDEVDADEFWNTIASGVGLAEGDARWVWRRWVERQQVRESMNPSDTVRTAITIKAWNAWREGNKVQVLSWRPGGASPEPFPILR